MYLGDVGKERVGEAADHPPNKIADYVPSRGTVATSGAPACSDRDAEPKAQGQRRAYSSTRRRRRHDNTEHTEVTYQFVTSANVVLFVLDVLTPLSASELDFLKTISEHCEALVFAVTKKDKVADYQVIVDNTRRKLSEVLGARARATPRSSPSPAPRSSSTSEAATPKISKRATSPRSRPSSGPSLGEKGGAILLLAVLQAHASRRSSDRAATTERAASLRGQYAGRTRPCQQRDRGSRTAAEEA